MKAEKFGSKHRRMVPFGSWNGEAKTAELGVVSKAKNEGFILLQQTERRKEGKTSRACGAKEERKARERGERRNSWHKEEEDAKIS